MSIASSNTVVTPFERETISMPFIDKPAPLKLIEELGITMLFLTSTLTFGAAALSIHVLMSSADKRP